MNLEIPEHAAIFLHNHGNVGRNEDELLRVAPTLNQLIEAADHAKREVDRAVATMIKFHGIKLPPVCNCGALQDPGSVGHSPNCPRHGMD